MVNHGLTDRQLRIIAETLRPYAAKIKTVGLFGSRATGTCRENSDIDMVLYGTVDEDDINRLRTLFEESALPMKVDVMAYHLIDYPPLKEHVTAVMKPLFSKGVEFDRVITEKAEKS